MKRPGPAKGTRPSGRQKGTPNKATVIKKVLTEQARQDALTSGILPLQVMLARMRNEPLPDGTIPTDKQIEAAALAAPYIHPRLASTDTTMKSDNVHRVVADKPVTAEDWVKQYGDGSTPVVVANDRAA